MHTRVRRSAGHRRRIRRTRRANRAVRVDRQRQVDRRPRTIRLLDPHRSLSRRGLQRPVRERIHQRRRRLIVRHQDLAVAETSRDHRRDLIRARRRTRRLLRRRCRNSRRRQRNHSDQRRHQRHRDHRRKHPFRRLPSSLPGQAEYTRYGRRGISTQWGPPCRHRVRRVAARRTHSLPDQMIDRANRIGPIGRLSTTCCRTRHRTPAGRAASARRRSRNVVSRLWIRQGRASLVAAGRFIAPLRKAVHSQ